MRFRPGSAPHHPLNPPCPWRRIIDPGHSGGWLGAVLCRLLRSAGHELSRGLQRGTNGGRCTNAGNGPGKPEAYRPPGLIQRPGFEVAPCFSGGVTQDGPTEKTGTAETGVRGVAPCAPGCGLDPPSPAVASWCGAVSRVRLWVISPGGRVRCGAARKIAHRPASAFWCAGRLSPGTERLTSSGAPRRAQEPAMALG